MRQPTHNLGACRALPLFLLANTDAQKGPENLDLVAQKHVQDMADAILAGLGPAPGPKHAAKKAAMKRPAACIAKDIAKRGRDEGRGSRCL